MRRYAIGIVFCMLLQAVLVLNVHSHHSHQLTHYPDSDYFVRPVKQTAGLVYNRRDPYRRHTDNWKWIALGEHYIRYQGQIHIHRYCSVQHRKQPKHYRGAPGKCRLALTLESWRIDVHPARPLCSCYRCITLPQFKKVSLRSGSMLYVIYYSGHVEIHKDQKTEHRVKPKMNAKPKQKMKRLEQHSRKRSRRNTKNAQSETRNRKEQRRRPQCGVSFHNP